jgi:hypothetical protein
MNFFFSLSHTQATVSLHAFDNDDEIDEGVNVAESRLKLRLRRAAQKLTRTFASVRSLRRPNDADDDADVDDDNNVDTNNDNIDESSC